MAYLEDLVIPQNRPFYQPGITQIASNVLYEVGLGTTFICHIARCDNRIEAENVPRKAMYECITLLP